jgi:hypothetical protein
MISYFSRISFCLDVFLFLSYSGAARAQTKIPSSGFLSLSEALQIDLTDNPLIKEVQAQVDISTERIVQAKFGFMPQIDASGLRFRPMTLTAAAVVVGASVILFDPIFQGLAISLMAGEVASLLFSRMTVPILYFLDKRWESAHRHHSTVKQVRSGS